MENSTKIMLGVTGVAVLGVGVWLITRKSGEDTTTTTTTTTTDGLDPSAQPVDTLGSTIGNLITNICGNVEKNKDQIAPLLLMGIVQMELTKMITLLPK